MLTGKTQHNKTIKVIQMGTHFLYLPFYFAKANNFYGFLPNGFEVEEPEPPSAQDDRNDETVYKILMESPDKKKSYDLAICDPIQVLNEKIVVGARQPVILCSMVTNAAFWAIDHKSHEVHFFRDLAKYNRIIAYQPGSTSYRIAKRIHNEFKKQLPINDYIITADIGKELQVLKKTNEPGVFALSPEIIDIDALLENSPGFGIDLSLGMTPEYSNVLVSALISRTDFVNNPENHEFIKGLLTAIQRAMIDVKYYDEKVISFSKDYFENGSNTKGALEKAVDYQVFPVSIDVNSVQWQNAVRAFLLEIPEDQRNKKAVDSYNQYIQPYCHFANSAVRAVFTPPSKGLGRTRSKKLSFKVLAFLILVSSVVTSLFNHVSRLSGLFLGLSAFGALWIFDHFSLSEHPQLRVLHWTAWALLFLLTATICNLQLIDPKIASQFDPIKIISVYIGLIGLDVAVLLKAYNTK